MTAYNLAKHKALWRGSARLGLSGPRSEWRQSPRGELSGSQPQHHWHFRPNNSFFVGAVLSMAGYLAASLASISHSPRCDNPKGLQTLSPVGQNHSWWTTSQYRFTFSSVPFRQEEEEIHLNLLKVKESCFGFLRPERTGDEGLSSTYCVHWGCCGSILFVLVPKFGPCQTLNQKANLHSINFTLCIYLKHLFLY